MCPWNDGFGEIACVSKGDERRQRSRKSRACSASLAQCTGERVGQLCDGRDQGNHQKRQMPLPFDTLGRPKRIEPTYNGPWYYDPRANARSRFSLTFQGTPSWSAISGRVPPKAPDLVAASTVSTTTRSRVPANLASAALSSSRGASARQSGIDRRNRIGRGCARKCQRDRPMRRLGLNDWLVISPSAEPLSHRVRNVTIIILAGPDKPARHFIAEATMFHPRLACVSQ